MWAPASLSLAALHPLPHAKSCPQQGTASRSLPASCHLPSPPPSGSPSCCSPPGPAASPPPPQAGCGAFFGSVHHRSRRLQTAAISGWCGFLSSSQGGRECGHLPDRRQPGALRPRKGQRGPGGEVTSGHLLSADGLPGFIPGGFKAPWPPPPQTCHVLGGLGAPAPLKGTQAEVAGRGRVQLWACTFSLPQQTSVPTAPSWPPSLWGSPPGSPGPSGRPECGAGLSRPRGQSDPPSSVK